MNKLLSPSLIAFAVCTLTVLLCACGAGTSCFYPPFTRSEFQSGEIYDSELAAQWVGRWTTRTEEMDDGSEVYDFTATIDQTFQNTGDGILELDIRRTYTTNNKVYTRKIPMMCVPFTLDSEKYIFGVVNMGTICRESKYDYACTGMLRTLYRIAKFDFKDSQTLEIGFIKFTTTENKVNPDGSTYNTNVPIDSAMIFEEGDILINKPNDIKSFLKNKKYEIEDKIIFKSTTGKLPEVDKNETEDN